MERVYLEYSGQYQPPEQGLLNRGLSCEHGGQFTQPRSVPGTRPPEEVRSVAANLDQRRTQRFQFLRALYEMSRGSERVLLYVEEVGDAVGLGVIEAMDAAQYLGEKRLIRVVMRNIISVSQDGIDELETALEQPEQATTHFPPAQSVDWKPVTPPLTITTAAIGKPPIWEESIREESIKPLPPHPLEPHPLPLYPLPLHMVQSDNDELAAAELNTICAAIGLDPKEITGELAPHHRSPVPDPVHKWNPEPIVEPVTIGHPQHQPDETDLDVMLEALSQQLPKLGLAPDELAKSRAEIDTARVQRASPKPKPRLLAAALQTLLSIRLSMTYRRF
jgi:hypothetical protein